MITISVPTQTFLRKFALHRANSQNGHIDISTTRSYGIHLLKVLQKRASWEPKEKLKDYPDELIFKISELYYSHEGLFISKQNIIFFNQVLKSEFEDQLFDFITINISRKIKTTIEDEMSTYLQFYGITETEKTLDSLLKAYQRWRRERNYLIVKA
jgi:hypothetical protein